MNAAAIKEHLKMLMELEKEVYTQNQVIASLEYQLSCLPDAHRYTRPVYTEANSNYQISGLTWLCFGSALIFLLLAPVSDAIINSDWGIMGLLLFPILLIFYLARSFAIPCAIFFRRWYNRFLCRKEQSIRRSLCCQTAIQKILWNCYGHIQSGGRTRPTPRRKRAS